MDNNKEVLLVEDNENDAELTLRAFRKKNLVNCITHLKDGEEALDYIFCKGNYQTRNSKTKPCFVVLDIKLPKVSGLDVLREIRNNKNTKYLPVVMLTSSNEEKDKLESYERGANSYVVKPVDFNQFMSDIEQLGAYWLSLNKQPS